MTRSRPRLFDPSAKIEWSPVWSLRDVRFKYIPTKPAVFLLPGPAAFHADSNGCAAGNTREEAIVQASSNWSNAYAYASGGTTVAAGGSRSHSSMTPMSANCSQLADTGRKLWVLTSPAIWHPTYVAILHWMQNGQKISSSAPRAHFDPRIALLRT